MNLADFQSYRLQHWKVYINHTSSLRMQGIENLFGKRVRHLHKIGHFDMLLFRIERNTAVIMLLSLLMQYN